MQTVATNEKRNIGIDLLRILSMFMVVVLHVVNQGGVIGRTAMLSAHYESAWALDAFTTCAVNCFAIISGYVGIKSKKYKYTNFAVLWLRVVFYTVLVTIAFAIFGGGGVTAKSWFSSIFPVMTKQYWYVTAYAGLFILMPLADIAAKHMTKRQYKILLIGCILLFSAGQTFFHMDTFAFEWGFSAWWLLVLYLIGGYIKIYGLFPNLKKRYLFLLYCGIVLIMWLGKFFVEYVTTYYLGGFKSGFLLFNNTSPFLLFAAIALFLLFERMEINSAMVTKCISFLSPLAFSVYLLHVHPLVWEHIITDRFAYFAQYPVWLMLLAVLGAAVGIYIVCLCIDALRETLFKVLKVKSRLQKVEDRIFGDTWRI